MKLFKHIKIAIIVSAANPAIEHDALKEVKLIKYKKLE